jgi:hypothetical protein
MNDYASGFLALILAGVLMMVIGIGLLVSTAHSPDGRAGLAERRVDAPASTLALRLPEERGAPLAMR